jgi:hypothetical protein
VCEQFTVGTTKQTAMKFDMNVINYTGRFRVFSVIANIYNKKAKRPTLMELFTAARKLKKFFFLLQLEIFNVCTTGDMARIDTIFKLLPHTCQHVDTCVATTCNQAKHYETPCSIMPVQASTNFVYYFLNALMILCYCAIF